MLNYRNIAGLCAIALTLTTGCLRDLDLDFDVGPSDQWGLGLKASYVQGTEVEFDWPGAEGAVTWSSSDPSVLQLESMSGTSVVATAVGVGEVLLTASDSDSSFTHTIRVGQVASLSYESEVGTFYVADLPIAGDPVFLRGALEQASTYRVHVEYQDEDGARLFAHRLLEVSGDGTLATTAEAPNGNQFGLIREEGRDTYEVMLSFGGEALGTFRYELVDTLASLSIEAIAEREDTEVSEAETERRVLRPAATDAMSRAISGPMPVTWSVDGEVVSGGAIEGEEPAFTYLELEIDRAIATTSTITVRRGELEATYEVTGLVSASSLRLDY